MEEPPDPKVPVFRGTGEGEFRTFEERARAFVLKTREDVYRRWGRRRIAAYWSVFLTLVTLRRPLRVELPGWSGATSSQCLQQTRSPLLRLLASCESNRRPAVFHQASGASSTS